MAAVDPWDESARLEERVEKLEDVLRAIVANLPDCEEPDCPNKATTRSETLAVDRCDECAHEVLFDTGTRADDLPYATALREAASEA